MYSCGRVLRQQLASSLKAFSYSRMGSAGSAGAVGPQANIEDDHVKEALKMDKGREAIFISQSVRDLAGKGDHFSSTVTSVEVKFSLMGKHNVVSYVVKISPHRSEDHLADFHLSMMKKENEFFKEILPQLNSELNSLGHSNLRMPRWLYTSLEEDKELIFLEDLRPLGFKVFDCKVGLDVDHTNLVLKELARLHAASLLLKAKTPLQDLAQTFPHIAEDWTSLSENAKKMHNKTCSGSLAGAEALLTNMKGYEVARRWLAKHQNNSLDLVKHFLVRNPKFDVICHGDCWVNNVQFRYSEGKPVDVMLLDLQLNRLASPATDLNYLLYTSLHGKDRKANWRDFLSYYYDSFRSVMEAGGRGMPFTLKELHQEYRNKMEYGMLYGSMTVSLVMRESSSTLDEKKKNPQFLSRFLALYGELIEQERSRL
nr:uncharacterized protein LOC123753250 [Procambarus clarkii]XP_045600635.1 uncharacterized protein LOC123759574 [Procambarus clarkii]